MKYIIEKTKKLNGAQTVPGSKSETIRAIVLALLSKGTSEIKNFLDCEDTKTALSVAENLDARVIRQQNKVIIKSAGLPIKPTTSKINTGNSGITTRFILPLLGLRRDNDSPIIFDCGDQMRKRPIAPLVKALNNLGMKIIFLEKNGNCPLLVKGTLAGGATSINGITSQYLSALLLSLPLAPQNSIIKVENLHERPYVEMTLQFLKSLGASFSHQKIQNTDIYKIKGRQKYSGFKKSISGDFSSASCLIAMGCLVPGEIILEGLDMKSPQGDKKLIGILKKMGADIKISNLPACLRRQAATGTKKRISVRGGKKLAGIPIDANDIPDLVPALAVIGTQAKGKTKIYNVAQARIKETDRIKSMSLGLRRMGARIKENRDGMTVYESALTGRVVNGFGDHRTIMALTVAGMVAEGTTTVTGAEAVSKTFPNFYQLVKAFGANIKWGSENALLPHKIIVNQSAKALLWQTNKYMKHIVLIGYKSVGKSTVGRELARDMKMPFVDLDEKVEKLYEQKSEARRNCRQIMLAIGQNAFRELEHKALQTALENTSRSIISLGGGAPLILKNKLLIKDHIVVQITAPKNIVFERIMINGKPAFFPDNEHPLKSFNHAWNDREAIYESLANIKVDNSGSPGEAVSIIRKKINMG